LISWAFLLPLADFFGFRIAAARGLNLPLLLVDFFRRHAFGFEHFDKGCDKRGRAAEVELAGWQGNGKGALGIRRNRNGEMDLGA